MLEKLIEKGFERIIYEDQTDKPVFYGKRFEDIDDVKKLHRHFGESASKHDFDFNGLYCHLEISEDLTMGQYLFSEIGLNTGYEAHDSLTVDEFESILENL